MVSGGTVTGDLGNVESGFSSYSSATSGLGSNWQGPSYDNFIGQAEDFIGEYKATISGEMSAFADACEAYEQYMQAYNNQKTAEGNVAEAIRVKDASAQSTWEGKVTEYKTAKEGFAEQIKASLTAASSTKLSATSLSGSAPGGVAGVTAANVSGDLIVSNSGYVFPFAKGVDAPITSHVGLRDAPTAGASSNHKGTDIGVPVGTEIHSLSSGTVLHAGQAQGYGQWVQIQQDDGKIVTYGHVSKYDFFKEGDRVNAGDVVALSGNEGVSTGPHLHLQIEDGDGNLYDSENFFEDVWYA